ncbi:MAG TPA: YHS domain-containing protein [Candidatus Thermoplasmatota archaeon]|nr:YHS domain-containing protein [Candidatus Thermoplasmatota archaeon]
MVNAIAAAKDPVCGMSVDPVKAMAIRHGGRTFYVCSAQCREKFLKAPDKYAQGA